MTNNPLVSNSYVGNNPDIRVRATEISASAGQIQHVRLDVGSGASESQITAANPLPITGTITSLTSVSTASLSNVSSSASSVTLLASNASRKGFACFNDSTQNLFIKFGATASSSSYTVRVAPTQYYEMPLPIYTGIIDGIWASANGSARITEL